MAQVARELSTVKGILEPFQTETTLEGQVRELRTALLEHGREPLILVGFSWGAYLSWIVAARYPALIGKLILVGSPPFDEQYAEPIIKTRLDRLTPENRMEARSLLTQLELPPEAGEPKDRNALLTRLGDLLSRSDCYAPQAMDDKSFLCQYEVFKGVWTEACELRRKKMLLHMGREITCPVIAIHGDYDPHPSEGVNLPLEQELKNYRFVLLKKCGHRPWIERNAAEEFYRILVQEI
jgi:pimeloyl-ACP methyl ester carboxylesterase